MIGLLPWVKLPSTWIEKHGLKRFKSKDSLADEIAALMVLVAIAHRSSVVDGSCRVTYEVLSAATQISRAKISSGLDVLADRGIVIREPNGRSTFQLTNFTPDGGWCQIPASRLYNGNGVIEPFRDFRLRRRAELDALKAYLLIACRRDTAEGSVRGRGGLCRRAGGVAGVAIEDVGLWWSCELQPRTEEDPDDREQYDADRFTAKA